AYVAIGVTVGAARFTPDGSNPSAMIANAGVALKNARQARLGSALLFEEAMNAELRALLHLTARMHKAIEERAFFLVYQPQVSLMSGRVVGVEALVRWRDGNQVVPPDQFIAAAESSGLILPLGRWVMEAALGQQRKWRDQGLRVRVAVNVSTRQLIEDEGFVESVRDALAAHGVEPGDLELEVTETLVISDMESGVGRLRQLREMGVQIAIDDFGTGYSSLGQLRHLPVTRLKIDRVFIQGLDRDLDDFHIAELIVRMGQSLGLSVLAEGVETTAQRDILEDLHCDEVQGYLYAKPAGPDELLPVLRRLGVAAS
ncbi:bifunctional diguanylate cyclase/phosphodiesterase, partial [Pelomonas sp. KK5]|uniref:putative bifunctional diguanylate cyclase/phosphodiesterase n=1 Tax=Pelomonas sp. KK5 TaxID=1855730 RepID=UPI00117CA286